jgi:nitrile hydratase
VDGVHDMGGMHGFGRVLEPDADQDLDQAYHAAWEPRIFALHLLIGFEGLGAGPSGRPVREEMDPADYLAASYYERWVFSAERRLERKGTVEPGEVEQMMGLLAEGQPAPTHQDPAMAERIVSNLRVVHPMTPPPDDARFSAGDRVRVKRMHPPGHTRCPRYARGVVGVVEAVRGADRLPDRAVYGQAVAREAVYSVAFSSQALWGPSAEGTWTVALDMWESYLEPEAGQ